MTRIGAQFKELELVRREIAAYEKTAGCSLTARTAQMKLQQQTKEYNRVVVLYNELKTAHYRVRSFHPFRSQALQQSLSLP